MEGTATFAVLGDIHGVLPGVERALEHLATLQLAGVLLVGDFASPAYERRAWRLGHDETALAAELEEILVRVGRLGVEVAWVAGNHDLPMRDRPSCCDRRLVVLGGARVYGIGGAGPDRFGFPYEWDEAEISALPVPDHDILLSHAPPARTALDQVARSGAHVGSEAVREIAARHSRVVVCGHIHEARGVDRLGDTICLNAGSFGSPYQRLQVGLVRLGPEGAEVRHIDLETGQEKVLRTP